MCLGSAMNVINRQLSFGRSKSTSGGRQWVHSPEALTNGRVVYNVKFLGNVEVDQPKGSDMVRDAIRKMKFNKQIKQAEGEKPSKVELAISIDAIAVIEPKYKIIQFQYPLHLVSYCADDKSDKRMFTFIAKDRDIDTHRCFVFDSDKCAEEITLTLGQAFNLAYHRFLDSQSKNVDTKKELVSLQQRVQELTMENTQLKDRVATLERLLNDRQTDGFESQGFLGHGGGLTSPSAMTSNTSTMTSPLSPTSNGMTGPPVLAPPPPIPSRSSISSHSAVQRTPSSTTAEVDLFGATPFTPESVCQSPDFGNGGGGGDVFGMPVFSPLPRSASMMDQDVMDMQAHFSRGLSIGTEDFSLEDLDPCRK